MEVRIGCHSKWGTICSDDWSTYDAQVACGQLGYHRNGAIGFSFAKFGSGTDDVWLGDLGCTGIENSLFDCHYNRTRHRNCSHSEDKALLCPRKKISNVNQVIYVLYVHTMDYDDIAHPSVLYKNIAHLSPSI